MTDDASQSNNLWVLGASLTIGGSILINLGTNFVKYNHSRDDILRARAGVDPITLQQHDKTNSVSSSSSNVLGIPASHYTRYDRMLASAPPKAVRIIGVILFVIGNLINFAALSFAEQSLLSALGSVQFVANVCFAYAILHVAVTNRILIGTALIVLGNVVVILGSTRGGSDYDADKLLELYQNKAYIIYLVLCGSLSFVGNLWFKALERIHGDQSVLGNSDSDIDSLEFKSETQVIVNGVTAPARKHGESASDPSKLHQRLTESTFLWVKGAPIIYAGVSALIGTQSLILAKSLSLLVRATLLGESQLSSPVLYCVLLAWASSMWFWLFRMDQALRRFNGAFIIPVLQVFWLVLGVVGGGIYFQEFSNFSAINIVVFSVGIVIIVIGVSFLAPSVAETDNEESAAIEQSASVPAPSECRVSVTDRHLLRHRSMDQRRRGYIRWTSFSMSMPLVEYPILQGSEGQKQPANTAAFSDRLTL